MTGGEPAVPEAGRKGPGWAVVVGRRVRHWRHLGTRFLGSLSPAPPPPADEAWVASVLSAAELDVWHRLPAPDRRHAVAVARRVAADPAAGSPAEPWVLAAALLHDSGKLDSGLGTFGRVGATVWAGVRGRERAAAGQGRVGRYLRHPELGAARLAAAGSDPRTVAWAREHHLPTWRWTVPPDAGTALKVADDD